MTEKAAPVYVNLPFERVPEHAGDPGFGPVPNVVPLGSSDPNHPSNTPQDPAELRIAALEAENAELRVLESEAAARHRETLAELAKVESDRKTWKQQALKAEAERDAAFEMSRCECGTDEACANLARLHRERDAAVQDAGRLRGALMNIMQTACDADEAPAQDLLRQILDVCVKHVQGVKGNAARKEGDK
jgi:hypothetical protein